MTLHKEGWMYCIIATLIYAIIIWLSEHFLGNICWLQIPILILFGLLWFWVFWFFRMPKRIETFDDNLIISPCDGKVVVIEETVESEYFQDKRLQVSIFMSPLNVHVNKYPMSGIVNYAKYHKGKYLVAWHPKSSTENERTTIVIKGSQCEILVRQVAGAVARRIIMYSKKGDTAKQNAELGFIKFGSRVDLYLPIGTPMNVKIGDIVQNGVSSIATIA
jgi:phosphatidylserine decarboxylase